MHVPRPSLPACVCVPYDRLLNDHRSALAGEAWTTMMQSWRCCGSSVKTGWAPRPEQQECVHASQLCGSSLTIMLAVASRQGLHTSLTQAEHSGAESTSFYTI